VLQLVGQLHDSQIYFTERANPRILVRGDPRPPAESIRTRAGYMLAIETVRGIFMRWMSGFAMVVLGADYLISHPSLPCCHCQSDWITQFALFLAPREPEVIELAARSSRHLMYKQNIMQSVIYLARSGGGGDEGGGGSQRPASHFFNQYPIDAALCGNAYSHSRRRARKKANCTFLHIAPPTSKSFFLIGCG
jgi:hypothetical protein